MAPVVHIAPGGLMIFHGIAKLSHGFDFIKQSIIEKGLPAFLWIGVPVGEVLAPILLILGIFSRLSGLMIAIVMLFAIYLAHGLSAFTINENGGLDGELVLIYMFAGTAVFFLGGGQYVLHKARNEWAK